MRSQKQLPKPMPFLISSFILMVLLSSCTSVPIKDHETLVRAFALLHAQAGVRAAGLRLVVVGGGPRTDACAALARAGSPIASS